MKVHFNTEKRNSQESSLGFTSDLIGLNKWNVSNTRSCPGLNFLVHCIRGYMSTLHRGNSLSDLQCNNASSVMCYEPGEQLIIDYPNYSGTFSYECPNIQVFELLAIIPSGFCFGLWAEIWVTSSEALGVPLGLVCESDQHPASYSFPLLPDQGSISCVLCSHLCSYNDTASLISETFWKTGFNKPPWVFTESCCTWNWGKHSK